MGNGGSRVNSTAVGIAVGFGILIILFTIGIVQFCCKYKCKKLKKCCKKKKKKQKMEFKDKILTVWNDVQPANWRPLQLHAVLPVRRSRKCSEENQWEEWTVKDAK
ncbi:uncharacterized protein LOC105355426 isoform X1 [Oryzias latipes]|uniref:uncharacterized protein LOC105355426 isoform X1 n=1 Tax=Oryzias latipes TaxID=8090 RepID=UPI0005CC8F00|nr:uncharacterized protein LOC105355426 isoform X1 [Oryzias latipes]